MMKSILLLYDVFTWSSVLFPLTFYSEPCQRVQGKGRTHLLFPARHSKNQKIFYFFFLPRRLDRAAKFHLARRRNEYEAPEINSVKFHSSEIYDKASNKNTACPSAHCWMIVMTSQVSISSSHITVQRTLISETLITVRHSKVQRPPG